MSELAHPFDSEAAREALGGSSLRTHDLAHGNATCLQVDTATGKKQLEIFDSGRAVRLSGPDFRLEAVGSFTPQISEGQVVLRDGHQTVLGLRSDGGVVFRQVPMGAETPQTKGQDSPAPSAAAQIGSGPLDQPVAPDTLPAEPDADEQAEATPPPGNQSPASSSEDVGTTPAAENRERGTLVTFTGRLGKDPLIFGKAGRPPHIRKRRQTAGR